MMKKLTAIVCAAALVALAASCNKLAQSENVVKPLDESVEYADVTFNVSVDGAQVVTKAATGAGNLDGNLYEYQVNKTSFFVFNEDGTKLEAYKAVFDESATMSLKLDVKYRVYALVNYNSNVELFTIKNETALKALAMELIAESRDPGTGFQMLSDATEKTFKSDDLTCSLNVTRIASRVRLVKVVNHMPAAAGNITINGVFLSNVVGNYALTPLSTFTWLNKYGRSDNVQTNIVTSDTAGAPSMTYQTVTGEGATIGWFDEFILPNPANLYCYANASTTVPAGWSSADFTGQQTMMVIVTTIGGKTYYYPINLNKRIVGNKLERNKTYDVSVVINNYGSEDEPNEEISLSTMTFNVIVGDWSDGGTVETEI